MDLDSRPRRRDGVLASRSGESVVLLVPASGAYFTLDDVGARIWELADGTRTLSEIAATVAREYDAAAGEIEADAREFLSELASSDLVETPGPD